LCAWPHAVPQGDDLSEIVNKMVPVAACSPHPMNYNRHDEEQIKDLRLSLRRFGQVKSIVVQDDGADGFLLVAGEGIWRASKDEEIEELRADVIPTDWEPPRVLAYLGADNELARRAQPDEAQLAALIEQVGKQADEELAKLAAGGELAMNQIVAANEWDNEDWSDLDDELDSLAGMEEVNITITVASQYHDAVVDFLANGESKTAPGMGKGVLKRCGLL